MQDTLDCLQIQEAVPVGSFGSVFWRQSYVTGKGCVDDYPNIEAFCDQNWTVHYAVPHNGGLKLEVRLNTPLRTDTGFENVDICMDHLMGTVTRVYTRDWNYLVTVNDLSIPQPLIECFEELLIEWRGERLFIHYCLLPAEAEPLVILVEVVDCFFLPLNADKTLTYIAEKLTQALAK